MSAPLFLIKEIPGLGKGWVASKSLESGTILIDERPLFHAPHFTHESKFNDPPICLSCGLHLEAPSFENNSELIKNQCSNCHWPVCSLQCEKMAIHAENECKIFSRQKIPFPPPPPPSFCSPTELRNFILLVRAYNLKKEKDVYEKMKKLQCFWSLSSINGKFSQTYQEQIQKFQNLFNFPASSADSNETEEFLQILKLALINAYSVDSKEFSEHIGRMGWRSGCYVYLEASRINHSCAPNCSLMVSPCPEFRIRIQTSVPVAKGEPLTVSYEPLANFSGTFETQRILQNLMGFICHCQRCADPTELGTFMSAVACQDCRKFQKKPDEIEGYLLPQNPLDCDWSKLEENEWKCCHCGAIKMASEFLPAIEEMRQMISKSSDLTLTPCSSQMAVNLTKLCETILDHNGGYMGINVHKNHWLLQLATRELVKLMIKNLAALEKKEIEIFLKLCKYLLSIQDKIMPGLSRNRAKTQFEISLGLFYLAKKERNGGDKNEMVGNLKECRKFQNAAFKFYKTFNSPTNGQLCWEAQRLWIIMKKTEETLHRFIQLNI